MVKPAVSAIDPICAGQLDALRIDQLLFQFSQAAKELWKCCSLADIELAANINRERRRSIAGARDAKEATRQGPYSWGAQGPA
jgi:hypothetical protein